ncbi:AMP-binding protein [Luminiphilus syltensis NOR5-1B]|uniref:AMP-binding protein n=1 Tax=Luminiphilus syltensis NOR5-1B TaxID=565045 RepID=B8KY67_9GAMM|nr:acyl-CoA synthetase [Luminiphilus syltensis]EED35136.1 AMP-binding protein [Luminiphilus syltensis NOR5-1B]
MMKSHNIYSVELEQNRANYAPLSPLSFLARSAEVYPDKTAIVHQSLRRTWAEVYLRCCRLAGALSSRGIGGGDTVALMAPNLPETFEAHFGVPMAGAVLNAINVRLDAETVSFILKHGEAKAVLVDREFSEVVQRALSGLDQKPLVIDIDDPFFEGGELIGEKDYEALLSEGDPNFAWQMPEDEWEAITLNYTSGTTGDPKGVVYHHRGAYLNAISNLVCWDMGHHPVYLWTLPMFHCNGWCFPWTLAASAGTSVCLRHVRSDHIFDAIRRERVDHFCAAPIVLNLLNNAVSDMKSGIDHEVKVMTAGAAPPASVIAGMEQMGFQVTHVYGLTETYGPSVVCAWQDNWDEKSAAEKARLKSRQGVRAPMQEGLMVVDPETLEPVPRDGETLGEVVMRGNLVMKGYLKNPDTTAKSFSGGWFHSGDLAVWHPDGYIEIKDRSKDIIISGGENISSIEVEDVLFRHPSVLEAAVVAMQDGKWGEVPCAFITLKSDKEEVTEQNIIDFCRDKLASFKMPKKVIFTDLPKTSTGKIQKYVLRQLANGK